MTYMEIRYGVVSFVSLYKPAYEKSPYLIHFSFSYWCFLLSKNISKYIRLHYLLIVRIYSYISVIYTFFFFGLFINTINKIPMTAAIAAITNAGNIRLMSSTALFLKCPAI